MLAVTGGACALCVALRTLSPGGTTALTLLLAGLAVAACAVVAEQSYLRWRLVGDAVGGRLAITYAVYGTVVVPLAATPIDGVAGAVGQLLGTVGATSALVSIVHCPDVASRARIRTSAVVVWLTAVAGALTACTVPALEGRLAALSIAGQPWLEVAGAAVVIVGAGTAIALGLHLERRSLTRTGIALALLVVAPAVASTGPTPPSAHLLAAAIQAGAVALVVPVAAQDTRLALQVVGRANSALRDRWRDVVEQIDGMTRQEAERTHELRTALAALEGASDVLRRHVERMGEPDDAALAAALASELGRLRVLVASLPAAPCAAFPVRDALLPVVLAHKACGQEITLDVPPEVSASGRPEALAEAVENLLTNAAVHAPGSHVTISAHLGRTVRVLVTDDGPGIDPVALADRQRASADRDGFGGLGLHLATRLVTDEGGSLTVLGHRATTGAAIAIELPRPSLPPTGFGDEPWSATAS